MGLDDLVDDVGEDKEKEELEELMDELGIEDKDDLEQLDGRLDRMFGIVLTLENDIENLKSEVNVLRSALSRTIKEFADESDQLNEEPDDETKSSSEGSPWR